MYNVCVGQVLGERDTHTLCQKPMPPWSPSGLLLPAFHSTLAFIMVPARLVILQTELKQARKENPGILIE